MAAWRVARSLETLHDEVNRAWPFRSKASDGFIGDTSHAASASDHNPNAQGVVCAFDITHDPDGCDGGTVFALLVSRRHPDMKYVIWNRTIVRAYDKPGLPAWTPAPYTGADPHTNHVHVSVGTGPDGRSLQPYDDTDPWFTAPITPLETPDMNDVQNKILNDTSDRATEAVRKIDDLTVIVKELAAAVAKIAPGAASGTLKVSGGELKIG